MDTRSFSFRSVFNHPVRENINPLDDSQEEAEESGGKVPQQNPDVSQWDVFFSFLGGGVDPVREGVSICGGYSKHKDEETEKDINLIPPPQKKSYQSYPIPMGRGTSCS